MSRIPLPLVAILAVACGGASSGGSPSKEPTAASSASPASSAAEAAPKAPEHAATADEGVPTKCAEGQADGICAPPRSFVQSLCGAYPKPDIALIMFAKNSPFSRIYMNRNMEGWYVSGQQSTSAKLIFDEELVVLTHAKASKGGMVVGSGGTPYDVLRFDGVCSTVEGEVISTKRPPSPKYALVPWQRLEQNVRDALLADPNIAKAEAARRKECKGTTSLGVVSPACAKADDKLSQSVVDYVKNGGQTPLPKAGR
jgi:hypothetical protein